ncbi:SPOR domain-containing protein [Robiginitalea sp. SC105]|uniref:HU domain-containing protein n=1 Tax=Robiginitalea sp. SC105 TaxID=2762332 RepID=UPI0016395603|nr:SPOR domain-containing protein [Robiginitalea sp. SC105]MBC2838274.1 HU-CCDC81 and SPOR domain-containing protein [Robiginitalea sp. SC105]
METARHIESLLYRYQCVVVPEFGAFLTQIKPAYLQKDSNTFYPPSKVLSFNAQLRSNDGLLVSHIAQAEKMSYEEALQHVEQEARGWLKQLQQEHKFTLESLGTFRLNSEKKIFFQPVDKTNFLTASFGLSSLIATPVVRETMKEEVEVLEERIPFTFTPESRETPGLRPYLKYAAILLLAVTAGISGYTFYQSRNASGDLVQEAAREEVSRHIQEATFFGSQPLELPSITLEVSKARKGSHHIIAGAFRVRENADRKIAQLRSRGYDARYHGVNAFGLHQVSCGTFSDPQLALEGLRKIKREVSNDAWLLSEK